MTLEEKLNKSTIISVRARSLKSMHILTKKQHILSILVFIFMALYTVATKIILNTGFDFLSFVLILLICINLVTLFILKAIGQTTIALNHKYLYSITLFINKSCKLGIFAVSIIAYYNSLNDYFITKEGMSFFSVLGLLYTDTERFKEIFLYAFFFNLQLVSFLISIVLFIPTFIYFLFFFIKAYLYTFLFLLLMSIPVLNIILCIRWIVTTNDVFTYYKLDREKNRVLIEKRKIRSKTYKLKQTLLKLTVSIAVIIFLGYTVFEGFSLSNSTFFKFLNNIISSFR